MLEINPERIFSENAILIKLLVINIVIDSSSMSK